MYDILLPFLIAVFNFILQSYPRFFNRFFGVDVWTRLIEIDQIRQSSHRIPGRITRGFIIGGYFDYPPVFPFLLSYFPKKTLEKIQGLIAPAFDSINCLLVYILALNITGKPEVSLLAQIIYSCTPLIALENSYLTPRSLGYLIFSLALYPVLIYQYSGQTLFLVIGIVFTTLIFISHRFATQSLLFAVILLSIYKHSFILPAVFITGFILAIIITKGYYFKVLNGHLYNIYFWVRNYQYRFAHQIKNSQPAGLDFTGKILKFLAKFPPVALFSVNPWIFSSLIYILLPSFISISLQTNPIITDMAVLCIGSILLSFIVLSFKRLIPIGEGQRYLEMTSLPGAILSSILFFSLLNSTYGKRVLYIMPVLIIGILGGIVFIQFKAIIKDKNRSLTLDMKKMFNFINKIEGTPRIICIPHQITTMTVYNTKADVLVNADNRGLMDLQDFFPVLKSDINNLTEKYQLDYLLLRESYATVVDLKVERLKCIKQIGDIKLIQL